MTLGGRSWSGGWRGASPNVVGIALLLIVVLGVVISLIVRG